MSFPDVYVDTPFHDPNWVLVRCRKNKRAFLWTYEYQGQMRINVKADPEWIDFWRKACIFNDLTALAVMIQDYDRFYHLQKRRSICDTWAVDINYHQNGIRIHQFCCLLSI